MIGLSGLMRTMKKKLSQLEKTGTVTTCRTLEMEAMVVLEDMAVKMVETLMTKRMKRKKMEVNSLITMKSMSTLRTVLTESILMNINMMNITHMTTKRK